MKGNIKLLTILFTLLMIGVTIHMTMYNKNNIETGKEKRRVFSVGQSQGINKVTVRSKDFFHTIRINEAGSILDDTIEVDEDMIQNLLVIIRLLGTKRAVATSKNDKIIEDLNEKGINIKYFDNANQILSFRILPKGNGNYNYAAIDGDEKAFAVFLEGVDVDIYEFFNVQKLNWQNRNLISATPNEIKRVNISSIKESYAVVYSNNSFVIPGFSNLDTSMVYRYLEQFQQLKLAGFFDSKSSTFIDSLRSLDHIGELKIETIKEDKEQIFRFYTVGNSLQIDNAQNLVFVLTNNSNSIGVMGKKYLVNILPDQKLFQKQKVSNQWEF